MINVAEPQGDRLLGMHEWWNIIKIVLLLVILFPSFTVYQKMWTNGLNFVLFNQLRSNCDDTMAVAIT